VRIQAVLKRLRKASSVPVGKPLAVTMNIGPLVLTNIGPPPVSDLLLSRAEARLSSRSVELFCVPCHDLVAFRCADVRRNR
jgi:hypothetical protein